MARRIPIIKLYRTLIVSIQIELSDDLVLELKDELAREMQVQDVDALIIEVSGVDIIDTFIARAIRDVAQLARLMGVSTVLAGLDPGMAITLVEIGMAMRDLTTAVNLEAAMESLGFAGGRAPKTESTDEMQELLADEPADPL